MKPVSRAATSILILGALMSCGDEVSPLPTSSQAVGERIDPSTGMPISSQEVNAPPDGELIRIRGNAFNIIGCPDECVIVIKKRRVSLPASAEVIQEQGGEIHQRSAADLRAGLPLDIRGTYRNTRVVADRILIREDIDITGVIVTLKPHWLMLETTNGMATKQIRFWLSQHQGIVLGSPGPGDLVLVLGKVRRDPSLPFVATRVQRQ